MLRQPEIALTKLRFIYKIDKTIRLKLNSIIQTRNTAIDEMEIQSMPTLSFGKYKGQPITTVLANDPEYLQWCLQQEWFNTKNKNHSIIYNICVNQQITHSNQGSKTPEHNRLQNLFLDDENVKKLLKHVNKQSKNKNVYIDVGCCVVEGIYNWDITVEGSTWWLCSCDWSLEDKDVCDCETFKKFITKYNIPEKTKNRGFDDMRYRDYYCEIKPLLGDDYPNVLRKMKQQMELTDCYISKQNEKEKESIKTDGYFRSYDAATYTHILKHLLIKPTYLLIVKEFKSSTTVEELIDIFGRQNITIVFLDSLDILPSIPQPILPASSIRVDTASPDQPLLRQPTNFHELNNHEVGLELELVLLQKKLSECEKTNKNHESEIKQLKDQLKEQQQRCKKLEEENELLTKSKPNSPQPISKTPKTINDYFGKK